MFSSCIGSRGRATTAFAASLAVLFGTAGNRQASADQARAADEVTAAAPATDNADGSATLREVVVTGSRVIRHANDSPTPVTELSDEELLSANPGPVAQALAVLPSLMGTPSQAGQTATTFQANIDLRGMGSARNLVLFDGHRLNTTTIQGLPQNSGVDTNLIPTLLLKRVDIVTGGASAVYGSDAISGVINYVVDNDFNGVKVTGQGSQSTFGPDRNYTAGIAAGTRLFGDRGHIEFSYQRYGDPGIENRYDTPWGRALVTEQGSTVGSSAAAGSAANPFGLYSNARFGTSSFGGLINTGPLAGLQFAQNGVLSPFVKGAPTGTPSVQIGGDGDYYTTYPAYAEQNIDQAFGRFDYAIRDDLKAHVEVSASRVVYGNDFANAQLASKAIGYNNAYLDGVQSPYQATITSQLAANPLGSFNYSRIFQGDQIPAPQDDAREQQLLIIAGLDGKWGNYSWSVGYEHQNAAFLTYDPTNINNERLYASLDAVVSPATGQPVCAAALTNPSAYGSCVPLNVFGPTATNNAAAIAYIEQATMATAHNGMDDVTASITGAPARTWAGDVNMALSAEWRRQSYSVVSSAQSTDPIDCTGIQFNCSPTMSPYFQTVNNAFPQRSVSVGELAYETEVPLIKDAFLAKSFSLNGAARVTHYTTSGTVETWKAGLTWSIVDSFSIRATRSRDIRAPTIQNLFQPATAGTQAILDVHTGVTAPTTVVTVGNPNLKPEQADTWTAGIIWTPRYIRGLSVSMDGYHINLTNALNTIVPTQVAAQEGCELSGGTAAICSLFIRPYPFSNTTAANFPTEVLQPTENVGGVLTYGVDTDVGYRKMIAERPFSSRLLVTYQPHLIWDLGPGGRYDIGGAADGVAGLLGTPSFKALLQLNYDVVRNFTATVQERVRNALRQNGSTAIDFAVGKLPPAWYTDLNFNYRVGAYGGALQAYLNIKNVFDRGPAPWASTGASGQIGSLGGFMPGDDILGRVWTLGATYQF